MQVVEIGNFGEWARLYEIAERKRHFRFNCEPRAHGGNCISSGLAAGSLDVTGDTDSGDSPGADSTTSTSSDDDDGGDADPEPARRRPRKHPSQALAAPSSGAARIATAMVGDTPNTSEIGLWRLPTVLANVPVSRSGWWQGVKDGRYPKPVRLSPRCVAWRASDIRALIASFGE